MFNSEEEFLRFLNQHGFRYERLEHPPVFTCSEADVHRPKTPAVATKNLFLCDKKARRFFLVVTACEKTVDLARLAAQLDVPHLRFGSEQNLLRRLGVTPGAVTMMALVNDTARQVELWVDAEIWPEEYFLSHPLVNTATLVLAKDELLRFFSLTGHQVHLFA